MNTDKVNDWLQVVGMLGVIASLVFVGVQVRQTQVIGEGDSATSFVEAIAATRGLMVDNADVWIRGCKGDELSEVERTEFAQLVRAYGQIQYFGWLATQNGILDIDGSELTFTVAANLHRYPGYAEMSRNVRAWGNLGSFSHDSVDVYRGQIRAPLAELEKTDPNPQYDPALCGM